MPVLPPLPQFREFLHDRLDMIAAIGPLRPEVLEALPRAVTAHLSGDKSTELYRRPTAGQRWAFRSRSSAIDASASAVVIADSALSVADSALLLHETGYSNLPFSLLITGEFAIFMFPHDLFDGTAGWFHIEQFLRHASGVPDATPMKPTEPRPLRASLRQSGLTSRKTLIEARSARREAEVSTTTRPQVAGEIRASTESRRQGFLSVLLDAETVSAVDTTVSAAEAAGRVSTGRSTRGMKLAAAALEAVAAALDESADLRIRMNVDLRRYAPRGVSVTGPFATAYPLGTVRTGDNGAHALTTRLAAAVTSKGPLAALVGNLVGLAKYRLLHPQAFVGRRRVTTTEGRRDFDLGVSLLPSRVPSSAWVPGAERVNGVILIHPDGPADPYVQICDLGDEVVVSLWDEAGLLDQSVFADSLRTLLDQRVSSIPTNPKVRQL